MLRKTLYYISLFIMLVSNCHIMTATEVPQTIRIGLESIAKDLDTITVKSEQPLQIGYYTNNYWTKEGVLETREANITRDTAQYYTYQEQFKTYEAAKEALKYIDDINGLVAQVERGNYQIYTTTQLAGTKSVDFNDKRINIKNQEGKTLLISEQLDTPIAFQGAYAEDSVPSTGIGTRRYRGVIEVVKGQKKGLTAVSVVPFEQYLYGVVNNEMGGSYPLEALKAQAVAARSMATFQYNRYLSRGYNLVDTTYSQVYKGITSEHTNTTMAVDLTKGEIARYNGKVAETIYGSSSGGHTENAKYVWGNEVPYLMGVEDGHEENNHDWERTITLAELDACLKDDNISIGKAIGLEIVDWTPSGRVKQLNILGSDGEYSLSREMPRTFFHASKGGSLKSTMYKFTPYTDGEDVTSKPEVPNVEKTELYVLDKDGQKRISIEGSVYVQSKDGVKKIGNEVIEDNSPVIPDNKNEPTKMYGDIVLYGKGYGHGVGMSQNGAISLARKGYTYDKIIEYYYPGVVVSY
ncbi:MAG: SpoIID/LytB domain-containing protein [Cellulosilyticaceae bacterium]